MCQSVTKTDVNQWLFLRNSFIFIFRKGNFFFSFEYRISIQTMMIFLIGFSTLTRDNGRVSMVTQIVVVECTLFSSSTKQIEIWLFCFVLISGRVHAPRGLVEFYQLSEFFEHLQIRKYLATVIS